MGGWLFKVVVAGPGGCGRNTIIRRFTESPFEESHKMTIGASFHTKDLTLPDGVEVKLQLWDFAGERRFRELLPDYCKGASGAILVFDVTDYDTFREVPGWVKLIRDKAGFIPIILLGNKADLEDHEVDYWTARDYAEKAKISAYIETSGKEESNIRESFELLSEILIYYSDTESLELSKELQAKVNSLSMAGFVEDVITYKGEKINVDGDSLNLQGRNITDIAKIYGLPGFKNLTELNLSNNEISEISGLESLTDLKKLILSNNRIQKVKGIGNLINLEHLELDGNNLSEISGLEKFNKLQVLKIVNNKIPEDLINQLGELDQNGYAKNPQKFVEYCNQQKLDYEDNIKKAEESINQQHYESALEYYREALKFAPNDMYGWNNMGLTYYYLNDMDKAIECFQKARDLDNDNYHPLYNLGLAYYSKREYKKAIEFYEKAADLEPMRADVWYNIGIVYDELGDYKRSAQNLYYAMQLNQNDKEILVKLADVHKISNNVEDALYYYEESSKLDPNDLNVFHKIKGLKKILLEKNLPIIDDLIKDNNYLEAIEYLKNVISNAEYYNLDDLLQQSVEKRELCEKMKKALEEIEKVSKIYEEIEYTKLISKTNLTLEELEPFLENLIFKGKLKASLRRDYVVFEKKIKSVEIKPLADFDTAIYDFGVFFSYTTADSEYFHIKDVAHRLESYEDIDKVLVWEEDCSDDIVQYMEHHIGHCKAFVMFCSEFSQKSEPCQMEWKAAFQLYQERLLRIIPIYENLKYVPVLMRPMICLRFNSEDLDGFVRDLYETMMK